MKTTAGIFIINEDGLVLVGHQTGSPVSGRTWTIPKGEVDPGEDSQTAAIRETAEEANVIVDPKKVTYIGKQKYKSGRKILEAFLYHVDNSDKLDLKCNSKCLDFRNMEIFEIDQFKWVTFEEAKLILHEAQVEILTSIKK